MHLPVDDEIYRVDNTFLGAPGKTLYWRLTYTHYWVGVLVFVLVQIIERQLGIKLGFLTFVWSLIVTGGVTWMVLKVVDPDNPVSAVWAAFWGNVGSPREVTTPTEHTFYPGRIAQKEAGK